MTTLPLIMKRSPIGKRVNVLFGIFQEIEGGVGGCCLKPFCFVYVRFFGQQVTYADTSRSSDGQCLFPPLCFIFLPFGPLFLSSVPKLLYSCIYKP